MYSKSYSLAFLFSSSFSGAGTVALPNMRSQGVYSVDATAGPVNSNPPISCPQIIFVLSMKDTPTSESPVTISLHCRNTTRRNCRTMISKQMGRVMRRVQSRWVHVQTPRTLHCQPGLFLPDQA
ncbi:hypothetical protein SISNIDRAFT_68113 [Sistotremastrum niveocremeum HHB9708]|uniref:Uncharacterized protein n=2 Tax=Sistotremastraceae TaxID=3402574 RepID=A0A164V2R7_9AGAM|nr:hypothetical protein SISNIDRAFT_68113 [Sistotremastrum niveocremeum HHB9708]KZT39907.1 hypothetical protein SISSUDRAFT_562388 [Sistotremastrum suecicum HHB10207 ss-3]